MAQSKTVLLLCVFGFFVCACSPAYAPYNNQGMATSAVDSMSLSEPPSSPDPQTPGGPDDSAGDLNICSKLSFQGAEWPQTLSRRDRTAVGLGLNITGSFEGVVGWKNISNNFDGMGMSLGLFQQNFGQGTLQPLLINMRQESLSVLERVFKAQHLASLLKMMKAWESSAALLFSPPSLWERELSPLDQDVDIKGDQGSSLYFIFASISPRNKETVDWALSNIYANPNQLNEEWKQSFQTMAESPEYVTQQIGAALHLHDRAQSYMSEFAFYELRSYLFFLDIVVQNGGIPPPDRDEFKDWEKSHASAKEEQRLLKLLEIRLRRVRSQYREDVRSRKTAIIKGSGIVHKKKRDLPKEYCYRNLEMY